MSLPKHIEISMNYISSYLALSTLLPYKISNKSKKKEKEAKRLLQIFYLGFIDGTCQLAKCSEAEQALIERNLIEKDHTFKDLGISDDDFPLDDWYNFANKGIIDKIEGRILYYGGLTARVHGALVEGYLDENHRMSNTTNAMCVPKYFLELSKPQFRKKIDELIDVVQDLDKQAMSDLMTNGPKKSSSSSGCMIPIIFALSALSLIIGVLV